MLGLKTERRCGCSSSYRHGSTVVPHTLPVSLSFSHCGELWKCIFPESFKHCFWLQFHEKQKSAEKHLFHFPCYELKVEKTVFLGSETMTKQSQICRHEGSRPSTSHSPHDQLVAGLESKCQPTNQNTLKLRVQSHTSGPWWLQCYLHRTLSKRWTGWTAFKSKSHRNEHWRPSTVHCSHVFENIKHINSWHRAPFI